MVEVQSDWVDHRPEGRFRQSYIVADSCVKCVTAMFLELQLGTLNLKKRAYGPASEDIASPMKKIADTKIAIIKPHDRSIPRPSSACGKSLSF